jgi:hypothetical protein
MTLLVAAQHRDYATRRHPMQTVYTILKQLYLYTFPQPFKSRC